MMTVIETNVNVLELIARFSGVYLIDLYAFAIYVDLFL